MIYERKLQDGAYMDIFRIGFHLSTLLRLTIDTILELVFPRTIISFADERQWPRGDKWASRSTKERRLQA
jgi:hypothetical protein